MVSVSAPHEMAKGKEGVGASQPRRWEEGESQSWVWGRKNPPKKLQRNAPHPGWGRGPHRRW